MQRIDKRVTEKGHELVKDGVTSVAEIERHLSFYVKKELFDGLPTPDPGNRRFFPLQNDIYNITYRASIQMRYSKIDQENLVHKINNWKQESPTDSFFLRPSTKSEPQVCKVPHDEWEEDDILCQMPHTKPPDTYFLSSFYVSKLMPTTAWLGPLLYRERPDKPLLKPLLCYMTGIHNGHQGSS